MRLAAVLDAWLDRLGPGPIAALALAGIGLVGAVDYLTGDEVSVGFFYLAPVALAAWYAGRAPGAAFALLACVTWYVAATVGDTPYSHEAIPVWNALIRLGFFLTTGLLLSALRRSQRALEHMAQTDALTGLYTRHAFEERLRHDLAVAQRRGSPLTLIYVDLDDFKAVNDTHGHAAGDRVLRAVGQSLRASTREADTVARLGGDEFALVLPDTDGAGAQRAVEKLRTALQDEANLAVTASIGAVTVDGSRVDGAGILAAGDALMYDVKRAGKRGVAFRILEGG